MIMNTSNRLTLSAVSLATLLLAGCGESDLEDQHIAELEAARAAQRDQPPLGAAEVDLDQYSLVFFDEFIGSEIDASKWNTSMPWGAETLLPGEQQYYVDTQANPDFGYDPFVLGGSNLTLTAIPTPEGYEERANNQSWLSGALSSHDKFAFTHGYVEARIDVPTGQGLWSAFWLLHSEFTARKPRVFIMDHDGATPESVSVNYNFENDNGELSTFSERQYVVDGFDEGFHVIGLEWSPESLRYFVDGQLLRSIPSGNLPEQDMHLMLHLTMGGRFVEDTDASTPSEPAYVIDYVRVYQKS